MTTLPSEREREREREKITVVDGGKFLALSSTSLLATPVTSILAIST